MDPASKYSPQEQASRARRQHSARQRVMYWRKFKSSSSTTRRRAEALSQAQAAAAIENERLLAESKRHAIELQARNEELDAFAHSVAHDLKNPLTVVLGYALMLSKHFDRLSRLELEEGLDSISRYCQKMDGLINALMMLTGVRKTDVEVAPLDMARVVHGACERLAAEIEEYGAEITRPASWPPVLGYEPWIEEVWFHYLNNAIRYGGEPPRVEMGFSLPAGSGPRFWVRDNGCGISPEEQARLFVPFERLEQGQGQGDGLGLAIVRRILEKLGGTFGVESTVGQGSTFFFSLPESG